jgi:hypothetical protein
MTEHVLVHVDPTVERRSGTSREDVPVSMRRQNGKGIGADKGCESDDSRETQQGEQRYLQQLG